MRTAFRQALPPVRRPSLALLACSLAPATHAAFIADSSASLTTSNIYLNRDYREGSAQNKREEWGQGFWLDMQSGYTDGTVDFGLDALGLLGLKLDSGGGRTGTDLLPVQGDGGDEWERDIELKYVVQSGALKDIYVRLRNASFHSDFARDADENRVIVGYTLPIW